ncbi:MAG TPA: phosphoglucosamine mutase [Nitrososphaerales archaeon]|nr:phosphoglucosamine mutase [Nitrososphaerales archaeon]
MSQQQRLFGTNGIRGVPGKDLSLEFVTEMAQSIGSFLLGKNPILIGHDVRNSSPAISKAVLSGVLASGSNANEGGLAPTPAHQFAVRTLGYGGGIIVTASHNPPQYNGMKVVGQDGVETSRQTERDIESVYFAKSYKKADWKSVGQSNLETRVVENYILGIMSQVNVARIADLKPTVVLDVGNGAQAVAAPYLCERLGCRVISINGQADGNFPGRGPEPTPGVLNDLSAAVKTYNAAFGVAYDGDGDRSLFCDENGEIYWGDRTGSLLVDYLLQKHKGGPVVTTVSTSQLVGIVAESRGANVIWTTVGSVDVSRAMIDSAAPLGLEENGGFFYGPHIPVRDGAMTTALILDALAQKKSSLSKALGALPRFYQKKSKFDCPNIKKADVMKKIEQSSSEGRIDRTDGLKLWPDPKTWILLRPSGTEPLIRVYAESDDEEKLDSIYGRFLGIVNDAIKS